MAVSATNTPILRIQITDLGEDRYQVETHLAGKTATRIAPSPLKRGEIFYTIALLKQIHSVPPLEYQHRLRELGNHLCNYVIPGNTFQHIVSLSSSNLIISLYLEQAGLLAFLPWEVMWHPDYGYLATHPKIHLTRSISQAPRPTIIPVVDYLRILRVVSTETVQHQVLVNKSIKALHLENLMPASLPGLIRQLEAQDKHILQLHLYMSENEHTHQILLSFDDPTQSPDEQLTSPQGLAEWIGIHATIRLIIIIPHTTQKRAIMPMVQTASIELLRAGIPAIVVPPPYAEPDVSVLYDALCRGQSLLSAVSAFRTHLVKSGDVTQWSNVTLFTNMTDDGPFRFIYSQD
jgi:hypothetical protein